MIRERSQSKGHNLNETFQTSKKTGKIVADQSTGFSKVVE